MEKLASTPYNFVNILFYSPGHSAKSSPSASPRRGNKDELNDTRKSEKSRKKQEKSPLPNINERLGMLKILVRALYQGFAVVLVTNVGLGHIESIYR